MSILNIGSIYLRLKAIFSDVEEEKAAALMLNKFELLIVSLKDVEQIVENWKSGYNNERPSSSLGGKTLFEMLGLEKIRN